MIKRTARISSKCRETDYQRGLKDRIEKMFPGSIVIKNDPNDIQGFPDLTVFWRDTWALLEVKASYEDRLKFLQPNQDYYVLLADSMSFGAFIYPENEGDVLDALQRAFESRGETCLSERQQMALDQLRRREAD